MDGKRWNKGNREFMKTIESLNNGDFIFIDLFGKEEKVTVFSAGDNKYDENGNYKKGESVAARPQTGKRLLHRSGYSI